MAKQKNVYFFGEGQAEGDAQMRDILGGKGANLAEMTNLKIPVPPGFTISTEVCAEYYKNEEQYPRGLETEVIKNLKRLEKVMGKKLGDPKNPLLVSVRSGAPVSMPGMMDTILNLGMNDDAVQGLAEKTGNPRFAWDAYRRFIQMYGDVVMEVKHDRFEEAIKRIKEEKNVESDTALDAEDLERLVRDYKEIVRSNTGKDFPQNPLEQLWGAINAVFGSWMNPRAIKYRQINGIKNIKGTAVNVQSMVFGNFGDDSGTGVCFSRDPSTGENLFYGEYLMNAQGEDVVAGIRTPEKISALEQENKPIYDELLKVRAKLEKHFKDMQDMEFTVQQGKLFLLQTRNGKRSGHAAVKIALDMVAEKLIDKNTAICRVGPEHIDQILHPRIDPNALKDAEVLAKGLNASPGAAAGRIVFTAQEAEQWHSGGEKVLLVRQETSPEDIGGMKVSQGILTATGGMTSHAAVVARGMGTPCIAGAKGVSIRGKEVDIGGATFREGDWITIDGSTGLVYRGGLPLIEPDISNDDTVQTFLKWCDEIRASSVRGTLKGFEVRTNADLPEDAQRAFEFGADGVGLCRTEHMFFDPNKLLHFRKMIVADSEEARKAALREILPLQQQDFFGIFKAMDGRPVTVRLLDPPLHEFVPKTDQEIDELARHLGTSYDALKPKIDRLHESNPMLGHRGCRLAVTYPEIYDMQVEAIARAAADCVRQNIPVIPEIMIPIVCDEKELALIRPRSEEILKQVFDEYGVDLNVKIGTMIEVPRAALRADKIAEYADFFSFGTNDLTQMTFAFSRDDIGSFIPAYLEKQVLADDPFKSIDEGGVGILISCAVEKGRGASKDLKIGICGEHGGDPATIDFCFRSGLTYVSCSPFRVPIARLAAAQAVIRNSVTAKRKAPAKAAKAPARGRKPAAEKAEKPARGRKPAAEKKTAKAPAKKTAAEKKPAAKTAKPKAEKKPVKASAEKKTAKAPAKKPATEKKPATARKPRTPKK
ncbi:MAG: pyruvate, phosphate dikinase [Spirochaetaceae bacterium]|nr:pyruvate, phosphate dikinase [Spirochaetaceae bacterium]